MSPSRSPTRSCGVLIPAYNEASRLACVVKTALGAALGPVLVVDDGSTDATAAVAREAGADVLTLPHNLGKGGAVFEGARKLQADVVVMVDADLIGLTEAHLRSLAQPVLDDKVEMTRGIFVGGRWRTTTAQRIAPQLNGQRGIVREQLLEVAGLRLSRYGIEIAITEHAKRARWRTLDVPMPDVSQVMKEEKRGVVPGFLIRLKMYREILGTWLRNLVGMSKEETNG